MDIVLSIMFQKD